MIKSTVFSIRLRILVVLLVMVTAVVTLITVTMANLFHEDKKAYITDVTSIVSISTAQETRAVLEGYSGRLKTFGRLTHETGAAGLSYEKQLQVFFEDFASLVGLVVWRDGEELASVFDRAALQNAGLDRDLLLAQYTQRSEARELQGSSSDVQVHNFTLSPEIPMLVMSVQIGAESTVRIVAMIRLAELTSLATREAAFDTFLVDSDGVLLAHPDASLLEEATFWPLPAEARALSSAYTSGVTVEFEEGGQPMIGGYAPVEIGGVVAGVQIPRSSAYLASRTILSRLVWLAVGLLALAALVSVLGSKSLTRPLASLAGATRELAKGRFDIRVPIQSRDEIGSLATSFNQMASELETRETALQEAQSQLVQSEKMAAFGQLGAGVAHEVKNPLAGILGCVQLSLRKVGDDTRLERNLKLIEKETKRCKSIVENLLRFARQEKAILEPIDVNPVVDDAVAIVNHQLELNAVQVDKVVTEGIPKIQGNANQLQQVFMNLMMNAQQAMGEDGGRVRIQTRQSLDGTVEVRVSDNGPGIPEDIRKKIFEPFFTTKPGGKGTGLGLSVSYGIITDHAGTIVVENNTPEDGGGAVFIMTFPAMGQTPVATNPAVTTETQEATSGTA